MTALVTGASGFLGGAIAHALLDRGERIRAFARKPMPELEARGAEIHRGDLADAEAVHRAAAGTDLVFHVGAKAGVWGPFAEYHASNVVGTTNVLAACKAHGIRKLVYTSSPSVVHAGADIRGADESLPYAEHFESAYPATKAEAERMVRAANGPELATVSLRPHLIWGPGDNQITPRLIARARAGRLVFPGGGKALIDSTYIASAVEAHLLAAEHIDVGAPCAGQAYFITQGEPMEVMALVNAILETAGVPPVRRTVPVGVAVAAGAVMETLWRAVGAKTEPPLTRFLARQLATDHYFSIEAARRDLGFGPSVSIADGLAALRAHFGEETLQNV
ncbi:MAG: NAD-dependent epimerase/dehydratase family protein [Polyangiales bacterium]|nr:NAD-dependent epimerase/dehydratase family protein [Myxococcales bacterium]